MKQSRWLIQTLILSATLNVALLGIFFYFMIRGNSMHFSYAPSERVYVEPPPIASSFLGRLQAFSFEHLVELLQDERGVDHGYQVRDFALGALATFYDFDVERALARGKLSKRKWEFDETVFLLFPGLKNQDFDTLSLFAAQEKWPLTTKGLYRHIERDGVENCEQELLNYFCHTPEFILLETLFLRTKLPIQKGTLLTLMLESGWERFATFSSSQEEEADFSEVKRRQLLLDSIRNGSKTAAYLLLITDASHASKQLNDQEIEMMLALLSTKTTEAMEFATTIAGSVRSDAVRDQAIERISEFSGDLSGDIAGRFYDKPGLKELRPQFRQQPPAAPPPSTHVIQPGESLWLIAKKYKISIETLMEANKMQSTVIQPGKTLKIPQA